MFCKHNWEILSETVTESIVQHAREFGYSSSQFDASDLKRKHIQLVTCKKCGKLKRFVEKI